MMTMMIKWKILIAFSCLVIHALGVNSQTSSKQVLLRIMQDESVFLDQYDTHVTLQKKPFKILVLMENVKGIYAFAAFSDSVCCRLEEMDSIPDFMHLPDRTMVEADYNKEKELLVNDDNSCAYWYYDKDMKWKGFNKKIYPLDSNRIVAVKSIKQLYYVPEKKEVKLKDVRQPLYLFFVAVKDVDENGRPVNELIRRRLRIDWIEEED